VRTASVIFVGGARAAPDCVGRARRGKDYLSPRPSAGAHALPARAQGDGAGEQYDDGQSTGRHRQGRLPWVLGAGGSRPKPSDFPNRYGHSWQIVPAVLGGLLGRVRACAGTMGDGGTVEYEQIGYRGAGKRL
jgi:hypothetical protein